MMAPLGLLVPMQFTDTVLGEPHIDPRDIFRDREVGLPSLRAPIRRFDSACARC